MPINFLKDFYQIVLSGLNHLSTKDYYFTMIGGIIFSILCFIVCNYYSTFWNKKYHTTVLHKILSGAAAILTFFFILTFISFSHLEQVATEKINKWVGDINNDSEWQRITHEQAYKKIKESGLENFENYPDHSTIPATKPESRELYAHIFSKEACNNFKENHPFLGKIVWAKSEIPSNVLKEDIKTYFANGNQLYLSSNAVKLVARIIKDDLETQAPRIVTISRIALVLLFFIVQAIPFGLIGWAAYKNLKITT